jgi:hypothetical protein
MCHFLQRIRPIPAIYRRDPARFRQWLFVSGQGASHLPGEGASHLFREGASHLSAEGANRP